MIRFFVLLSVLLVPASLVGSATGHARPLTPEDIARLEYVGEITASPDGKRIAYTTLHAPDVTRGEANGPTRAQLILAWGAMESRPFLPASMNVSHIRFSPDGRLISFIWAEPNGWDAVYAIPVDGGAHRKIGEIPDAHIEAFAWSPDSAQLYMLADPQADDRRQAERQMGFNAIVHEEEAGLNRLFVARASNQPDPAPREIAVPGHVSALSISRDGTLAILQAAPGPLVDDSYTAKQVHILNLNNGALQTIPTTGKIGDVELSPDGKIIAMLAAQDKHDPAATTLYFADVATGTLTPINAGAKEAVMDTVWIDDQQLAALIHQGATSHYRIYARNGAVLHDMPTGPQVLSAIEAAGGLVAARASSPTHPAELYVLEHNSFKRWSEHNPWLDSVTFGHQRLFHYTARDGQNIEGILIEPVGGVKKGGAPTILDVHGGPESHETNGWQTYYAGPGQVAAGRGYAVFLPNYRGSTGYGTDFSKQHQGDYAGKEFDDLVDAREALIEAGIADPARIGITGGSYGGYATAWAATAQSEYFAAGVMFVGISNQLSKFGTSDIPQEMYLVHDRKWPWEEWDRVLKRSPIFHAGKAKTPLLILHGLEDTRVDKGQSLELYRHIKTRTRTPVRLVFYPGEGHGNRNAAARYDYNLRMMEWFDAYLRDARGPHTSVKGQKKLPPPRPRLPEAIAP